ncbi:MAG TPA: BREX system Lon protease-like protein BrxL, partial [Gemmataceae bacterium]|nr:BREX system Lon protease-like protein BrxL [Gemmataceae bacterium]
YLPGWEIPKLTPAALSQGVGFVTDYFGEVLAKLREDDFQSKARELPLAPGLTRRDQVSVERVSSGLIKLLYPDGKVTAEEFYEIVDLACELRQRVHDQLGKLAPGEFPARRIGRALAQEATATPAAT